MSKPYDATTRFLVSVNPVALLRLIGVHVSRVALLDTDLSTVTAAADPVIRVSEPYPYIVHVEFQSGYEATFDNRAYRYNALVTDKFNLPVATIVFLLRPDADGPVFRRPMHRKPPIEPCESLLGFRVVRVWDLTVEQLMEAGVEMLPLAPLANVPSGSLPDLIDRMSERIRAEVEPDVAAELWTATYVLMGLKFRDDMISVLLKGVREMEESTTYQAIIAKGEARGKLEGKQEGRAEEARRLLLRVGRARCGAPTERAESIILAIEDIERLETLVERAVTSESWSELLD